MLIINNKIIKNEFIKVVFGKSFKSKYEDHGKLINTVYKNSPRFYIEGTDDNNDEVSLMLESFIDEEELKMLKLNEEVDFKTYLTDVIYYHEVAFWPETEEIQVSLKRIDDNKFKLRVNIEEFDLLGDEEQFSLACDAELEI